MMAPFSIINLSAGLGRWTKSTLIVGSGVVLCGSIYVLYKRWRQSTLSERDEGFVDVSKCDDDDSVSKVLLVGLPHSGKSSIMSKLHNDAAVQTADGCYVTCVTMANMTVSIWQVSSDSAEEWRHFVQDTSVLIYIVDSSDATSLPEAFDALHTLLGDPRLHKVPIIVLANKQDVKGAMSPQQIVHALGLDNMSMGEHRVHVVATTTSEAENPAWVQQLQKLVVKLIK